MSEVKIAIDGMTCGGCVSAVERALKTVPGVEGAAVSLERNEAVVRFDGAAATPESLVAAVERAGFDAEVRET